MTLRQGPRTAVAARAAATGPDVEHPAVAVGRVPGWTSRLDVGIALVLALWGVGEVLVTPELRSPSGVAFALVSTLPLLLRRRLPVAVTVVICAALLLQASTGGVGASFTPFPGLLVATFTVAVQVAPTWWAALVGTLPVVAMYTGGLLGFFGPEGLGTRGGLILVFFVGSTWAGGRVVRQRALAALDAERGRRLAEERAEGAADRAVEAERARIARELHDVVAHAVSVVVLQTGAAEQFLDRDVERARTHLGLARRTATEAMSEMRHLLDVLREGEAVYVPQPGVDRLEELVEDARATGLPVTARVDVDGEVPDGPSLAVYRLVQESLTNVRRHAPGARTEVVVSVRDGVATVLVRNDAPPSGEVAASAPGGHGLPGMQERVRVYGGDLVCGPTPDGGWTVRATLPLAAR